MIRCCRYALCWFSRLRLFYHRWTNEPFAKVRYWRQCAPVIQETSRFRIHSMSEDSISLDPRLRKPGIHKSQSCTQRLLTESTEKKKEHRKIQRIRFEEIPDPGNLDFVKYIEIYNLQAHCSGSEKSHESLVSVVNRACQGRLCVMYREWSLRIWLVEATQNVVDRFLWNLRIQTAVNPWTFAFHQNVNFWRCARFRCLETGNPLAPNNAETGLFMNPNVRTSWPHECKVSRGLICRASESPKARALRFRRPAISKNLEFMKSRCLQTVILRRSFPHINILSFEVPSTQSWRLYRSMSILNSIDLSLIVYTDRYGQDGWTWFNKHMAV